MIKGHDFSSDTPYKICQQYSVGMISRSQLIEELSDFPYSKSDRTDGYDSLLVDPPGSWSEISLAIDTGLIDEKVYEEVFFIISISLINS